jgi:hypothetical protein
LGIKEAAVSIQQNRNTVSTRVCAGPRGYSDGAGLAKLFRKNSAGVFYQV